MNKKNGKITNVKLCWMKVAVFGILLKHVRVKYVIYFRFYQMKSRMAEKRQIWANIR